MKNDASRRRDPRYVEESENLSDWVQVRLAEQFHQQREANGLLWDLTPRAVKVAFPAEDEEARKKSPIQIGTQTLLTFRFRSLTTVTAVATVARIDAFPNGVGVVLFFDYLRDSDRDTITRICEAYERTRMPAAPEPK